MKPTPPTMRKTQRADRAYDAPQPMRRYAQKVRVLGSRPAPRTVLHRRNIPRQHLMPVRDLMQGDAVQKSAEPDAEKHGGIARALLTHHFFPLGSGSPSFRYAGGA
jgi:hypothetical protein